jgi:hypothetical protein
MPQFCQRDKGGQGAFAHKAWSAGGAAEGGGGEAKRNRVARCVLSCHGRSPVARDDPAADREPDAHAIGLGAGEEPMPVLEPTRASAFRGASLASLEMAPDVIIGPGEIGLGHEQDDRAPDRLPGPVAQQALGAGGPGYSTWIKALRMSAYRRCSYRTTSEHARRPRAQGWGARSGGSSAMSPVDERGQAALRPNWPASSDGSHARMMPTMVFSWISV